LAATPGTKWDPSLEVLKLHYIHRIYQSFAEFEPYLPGWLALGDQLQACEQAIRTLGFIEPFSGAHLAPEAIRIDGPNYRESVIANGLLSRNRAVLKVLESCYGSLDSLRSQPIYLAEAVTAFAIWLRRQVGDQLTCSEYMLDSSPLVAEEILHQDLCSLSFDSESFGLVICNELFEHVYDLQRALEEIGRVLRPGGRLVSTFPMAFGQLATIQKARWDFVRDELVLEDKPDYHGDPIRPHEGSLVYCIPGWDVLEQACAAGFQSASFHFVSSWKHGILGGDIPGVLVMEAQR
jgi:SAM-dependent methyltransferase